MSAGPRKYLKPKGVRCGNPHAAPRGVENKTEYIIICDSIKNSGDAPKGIDIFYRCTICNDVIPSCAGLNSCCKCGNIKIDFDYVRLYVDDYAKFQVVKKKDVL